MAVKKFKVVCTQEKFSDKIYIDIAPDRGVIHDQIFFSRIQLQRRTGGKQLERLYGSIYLQDADGKITVDFPSPQVRKNSPDYNGVMRQYAKLESKIIRSYQEMIAAKQETTLFIYGVSDMFEMSAEKNAEAEAFEKKRKEKMQRITEQTTALPSYRQKHREDIFPQTLQEEQRAEAKAEFTKVRNRRLAVEQKRAQETTPAWLRFQKEYSGD